MSGPKKLKKGEVLFREGDPSEAMYVIQTGKVAILKSKGTSEILLAELGPGDMLGEMAFFDGKPRSASARAAADTVIIELPFKALMAQFKTFPEWLKAVVRTVNNHLRNANSTIKNLQKTAEEETQYFSPHLVNRLMAVLCFIATRFGEKGETPGTVIVPSNRLRNYTIQVFQLPTAKMTRLTELLQDMGYIKIEDLGEGRQKLTLSQLDLLMSFVDFYNDYLFKSEDKRVTVDEKDMKGLKAIVHYGKLQTPDTKGVVTCNLTQMSISSPIDLNLPFDQADVAGLADKKITGPIQSGDGFLMLKFQIADVIPLYAYWDLIYRFKKVPKPD
jgi:CRP/FNR family cyclic AMP-dependent transcriptional regulator